MAKVVKHAWTHRPRSEGGTDPIEISGGFTPSWCKADQGSGSVAKDGDGGYPISFTDMATNDTDCFEFANLAGSSSRYVKIMKAGYYLCHFSMCLTGSAPHFGANEALLVPSYNQTGVGENGIANAYYFKSDFFEFFAPNSLHTATEVGDNQGLYTFLSFHWDPDNPVWTLDDENPLEIGFRVDTTLSGSQALQGQMQITRIAEAGYTATSLPI